jgi:hypothetical protein
LFIFVLSKSKSKSKQMKNKAEIITGKKVLSPREQYIQNAVEEGQSRSRAARVYDFKASLNAKK